MLLRIDGQTIDVDRTLLEISKAECRDSLAEFVRQAWHVVEPGQDYVHGWHIDVLCAHLEAITDGVKVDGEVYNRLLVNIPPGTMKSLAVSVFWPAWEWGPCAMPEMRYVCAAHSQDLAIRDNLRMRRLIMSDWYQERWPHVQLSRDQAQKTKFENTATGFRMAVAAGSITGSRGDRVICFPYDANVLTSSGWLPIGAIVEQRMPVMVAGSDGCNVGWQSIEAYERNPARPLVRIIAGQRSIECTEDHLVYVDGKGWTEAARVEVGDSVVTVATDRVPPVWEGAEHRESVLLPRLLLPVPGSGSAGNEHGTVRDMQSASVSHAGSQAPSGNGVLLAGVFGCGPHGGAQSAMGRREDRVEMPEMREYVSSEQSTDETGIVVFGGVRFIGCMGQAASTTGHAPMRDMRQDIQAKHENGNSVFAGMCGGAALATDEGCWERTVYPRGSREAVSYGMDTDLQEGDPGARWGQVHDVPCGAGAGGAGVARPPYRLQEREPFSGEPDNGLSVLPWEDARGSCATFGLERAVVESVERSARVVEHTYNVRVAPYHNYFANGILVHNCDDPHSVEGAMSEAQRETTNAWFTEAVPTRLNNPKTSAIVVVMQRLHEDDVSGLILNRQLGYDHLMLPMRYDPQRAAPTKLGINDPRTEEGELLFPERFPIEVVDRDEKIMGIYATAGQHQQQPTPRGGGIIKRAWWQPWEPAKYPVMSLVVASLDPAYTEKQENDYSALTVWGVFGSQDDIRGVQYYDTHGNPVMIPPDKGPGSVEARPRVILMSAWAERLELHNLVNKVAETCKRFGVDRLLIEAKASGHSVAQELNRIYAAEPWAVHMVNPGRVDKTARAHSVVPLFTDELVHVPMVRDGDGWKANRDWAEKVIAECEVFPKGKHDDRVDSVVQALRHLREIGALTRTEETSSAIDEAMAHSGPSLPALYPV